MRPGRSHVDDDPPPLAVRLRLWILGLATAGAGLAATASMVSSANQPRGPLVPSAGVPLCDTPCSPVTGGLPGLADLGAAPSPPPPRRAAALAAAGRPAVAVPTVLPTTSLPTAPEPAVDVPAPTGPPAVDGPSAGIPPVPHPPAIVVGIVAGVVRTVTAIL